MYSTHAKRWADGVFVGLISTGTAVELTLSSRTKAVGETDLTWGAAQADAFCWVAWTQLRDWHCIWGVTLRHLDALYLNTIFERLMDVDEEWIALF